MLPLRKDADIGEIIDAINQLFNTKSSKTSVRSQLTELKGDLKTTQYSPVATGEVIIPTVSNVGVDTPGKIGSMVLDSNKRLFICVGFGVDKTHDKLDSKNLLYIWEQILTRSVFLGIETLPRPPVETLPRPPVETEKKPTTKEPADEQPVVVKEPAPEAPAPEAGAQVLEAPEAPAPEAQAPEAQAE